MSRIARNMRMAAAGALPNDYEATVLEDTPLAYWRLGESSGSTATDASGNGHHGTYVGTITKGVAGAISGDADTAVTFGGTTSDYMDTVDVAAFDVTRITVEAWIKHPASTDYEMIMARDDAAGNRTLHFRIENSGVLGLILFIGGTNYTATGTTVLDNNTWYHVVGTYDGSNLKVYVNGAEEGSTAKTGNIDSGIDIWLGRRQGGAATYPFNGSMDEVAYYDHALSLSRIQAHYNKGIGA